MPTKRLTQQTTAGQMIGPKLRRADFDGQDILLFSVKWCLSAEHKEFIVAQCYKADEVAADGELSPDRAFWFTTGATKLLQMLKDPEVTLPATVRLSEKKTSAGNKFVDVE